MKKMMSLIFVCFFALTIIAGCGANKPNSDASSDTSTDTNDNVTVNIYGNTPGNLSNGGFVAQQGDWIYYKGLYQDLYKIKTDGSEKTKLTNHRAINQINVVGDWIYYMRFSEPAGLYKVKTDGTESTLLMQQMGMAELATVVKEDWIYGNFSEGGSLRLYKIKTDGTEKTILGGENAVTAINVVGDWIYYISSSLEWSEGGPSNLPSPPPRDLYAGDLYRIKIDGTEKTKLSEGNFTSINVVDDWVYFMMDRGSGIYKMKTDGSEKIKLADDKKVDYINVAGDWIYYISVAEGERGIFKMKTDGTEKTKLTATLTEEGQAPGLNIAGEWIYYGDYKDINKNEAGIYKIKTDGTGKTEVEELKLN